MACSLFLLPPAPSQPRATLGRASFFQKTGMISCRYSRLFAERARQLSLLSWQKGQQSRGPWSRRPGSTEVFQ